MEANENNGERKIKRFKVRERERGGSGNPVPGSQFVKANENIGERKIKRFKVRERERGGSDPPHFFLARPPLVVLTRAWNRLL